MAEQYSILSVLNSWEERVDKKMKAVEVQIQAAGPTKDTIARVADEFRTFRELVFDMLKLLRLQIGEHSQRLDDVEARSRRKALIIQGIAEVASEDCTDVTLGICNTKLGLNLTGASIKVCHRLGQQTSTDHHRPILVRFASIADKMKVWRAKTGLRGSKIAVKEFLTKSRQSVFVKARQHFGMRACWTHDGVIHIKDPEGGRHKMTTLDELNPLMTRYPKTQGTSPAVVKRPAAPLAVESLKGTKK
ncbi:hypothetical protein HW555_011010 [Spodoptera exigua]|uniref:Uncharacterized protein n=1 Tax=Spodoptera exigua TaxID=7107 RepID=A0A835L224_SPOEX|nr:hypothetical protein HW555_011010 [Spodoptera exigua]